MFNGAEQLFHGVEYGRVSVRRNLLQGLRVERTTAGAQPFGEDCTGWRQDHKDITTIIWIY